MFVQALTLLVQHPPETPRMPAKLPNVLHRPNSRPAWRGAMSLMLATNPAWPALGKGREVRAAMGWQQQQQQPGGASRGLISVKQRQIPSQPQPPSSTYPAK